MSSELPTEHVRRVVFGALAAAGLEWQTQHATNFVMSALKNAGLLRGDTNES